MELEGMGINIPLLISQAVSFGILFFILYKVGFKKFLKTMDERSMRIKESLEAGEKAKLEAAQAEEEVAKRIEAANLEGQKIVDRAVQTAEEIRKKAEQDARKQADAIIVKAQAEIAREKEAALVELRKEVADLAVVVAGKAISKSLDEKAHQDLINSVLKEAAVL
ncbi:MAG: F0F1 ATP synthase subunit B [Dehalococcoidales bacterium]|jgi:F-type H+-transporting ATPase subunit b|nr:F0F1 ATP synthase subunit B [Dehalococcoidales bacterium]MDD5604938.1 F0F1 ATP synthase subunit B [Dehalococcoidales bacterium]MDX9986036.1 F0F1 ATP synthase subunit B [Dehalococcoidales bacterium]NLE90438.1 F0F1 ATP synthase subunit B [Dehalococcoidales bacterium]